MGFPLEYSNPANLARWKERFGVADLLEAYRQIRRHRTSPNGCFGCKLHYSHYLYLAKRYDILELFPTPGIST